MYVRPYNYSAFLMQLVKIIPDFFCLFFSAVYTLYQAKSLVKPGLEHSHRCFNWSIWGDLEDCAFIWLWSRVSLIEHTDGEGV